MTGWDRATVIHALADAARREREARIDQLVLIARAADVWSWIDNIDEVVDTMSIHPDQPDPDPAGSEGVGCGVGERLWRYGADGSPEASEFLRFEIGPALGISPDAAAVLIGNVLDLRHRLPGLWAHIESDLVPGWVGCKVAELTRAATLSAERCRELDRQLAPRAPGLTPGAILNRAKRLITVLDPASTEARRRHALAARFVQFYPDRAPDGAGTLNLRAQLNGPEGLDLEATINALADVLEVVEPDTARPVLRAKALELLADPARAAAILTGDLTTLIAKPISEPRRPVPASGSAPGVGSAPSAERGGASRVVSLVVHVNPADLATGAGGDQPRLGTLARSHLDTLLTGCAKVVVKPVIDPMAVTVSASNTPPPAMRKRVEFRNPTVIAPFSTRASTSRHVDLDHTIPLPDGPTTEPNLGPLDRRAHRWKTHTTCHLDQVRNGTFRWTTPAGQIFWVTPYGTYTDDPGTSPPTPPPPRTPDQSARDLINRAGQAIQRAQNPDPPPRQDPPASQDPPGSQDPPRLPRSP